MNTEIFIVFLFLVFIFLLDKNKEGFKNPLIPPSFEFAVLTPPQEVMSGYYQEELCKNDPEWISGNKRCHHILDKDDCTLTNNAGVFANDACLIACDTCPSSVEIKFRDNNEILEETLDDTEQTFDNEDEDESPSNYDILDIIDQIDKRLKNINLRFENNDLLISQDTDINELEASIERLNYYNELVSDSDILSTWPDRQDEIKQGMCDNLENIELLGDQSDTQITDLIEVTRLNLSNLDYECLINIPSPSPVSSPSS